MGKFPNSSLRQKCVYWGSPQPDGFGGFTYDDPVELDCRWVDSIRVITDQKGNELVSRARVQVDSDLDYQGLLYLGRLEDLSDEEKKNPKTIGTYSIKRFDKIPTLDSREYYRIAYL